MKNFKSVFLKLALGVVVLPLTALAQSDKLQLELGRCAVITNVIERLACYDEVARPLLGKPAVNANATATGKVESVPGAKTAEVPAPVKAVEQAAKAVAPARAESEAGKIDKFGQQQARLDSSGKDGEALVDKVAQIKEIQTNKVQITLANGQVWQQAIAKPFFVKVNETARITSSGWGNSFRLEIDGRPAFIQVNRLR